jgi:T-complex protein 1 subunit alpha
MSSLITVFRFKGNDARKQNCTAAIAIANVIKSSLGPVGLDKMIVSAAGEGEGEGDTCASLSE